MPLRFARGTICLLALLAAASLARAEPSAATPGAAQEYFSYAIHPAESLIDVARIFGVPVRDLVTLNHIEDPNRIEVGRTLRIPNAFAREVATLGAERERLLDAKRRAENEAAEHREKAAALSTELRRVDARNQALESELAGGERWKDRATVLAFLLVVALVWALKARVDRALMARRQRALVAENSALRVAKEKLGEAAVQHELRLQSLYGHGREPASEAVAEGRERLRRAFQDGAAEIERQLEPLRLEQERRRAPFRARLRALSRLFHPVRGLLERRRPKYHTP